MKRVLSFILAFAMIISLLPVISAADGENNISITYDIAKYLAEKEFGWAARPDYSTLDYSVTKGFFNIVHSSEDKFVGQGYNGVGTAGTDPKYIRMKKGNHISFELNVPAAGTYTLKADYPKGSAGGNTNVYVTDKATFDGQASFAIANLGNVGTSSYNCASGDSLAFGRTTWEYSYAIAENLQLSQGKYVVTLHAPSAEGTVCRLYLVAGDGSEVSLCSAVIESFENDKVNLSAYKTDGSKLELNAGGVSISYDSDNKTVATVDSEGKITVLKPGSTKITATVTYNGLSVSDTRELFVSDGGLTVKYALEQVMSDNAIYYVNSAQIGSAEAKKINYTMTKGFFAVSDARGTIAVGGSAATAAHYFKLAESAAIEFKINVPKAGTYVLKTDYQTAGTNYGTTVDVYIDGEKKGGYNCSSSAVTNNFTGGAAGTWINNALVTSEGVELSEGEHTVIFTVPSDGTSKTKYGTVCSFYLIAGDGRGKALTSLVFDNINSGTAFTGYMSDGSIASEEDLSVIESVTYDSSDKSVATVDENGVITDIKSGQTTITAVAKIVEDEVERYISAEAVYASIISDRGIEINYDIGGDMQEAGLVNSSDAKFMEQVTYEFSGGLYKWLSGSASGLNTGSSYLRCRKENLQIGNGCYIAFEVFIPEAGKYTMEMKHGGNDAGVDVDVYVSEGVYSTNASDYIGSYSCYDPTVAYNPNYFGTLMTEESIVEGIKIYEPGYYVITFRVNGTGSATSKFGSVGSFKLRSGGDSALLGTVKDEGSGEYQYIVASLAEKDLIYSEVGNYPTTQLSLLIKNMDGTVDEAKSASVVSSFRPNDRAVAGIDRAGLITGYSEGKTDIYIDAIYGENSFSGALAVNVIDDTGVASAYIDIPEEVYVREKIKVSLVAVMNSGDEVIVPVANTNFVSKDGDILKVSDDGMFTGMKDGKATIKLSTKETFRGSDLDAELEVKVTEHEGKSEPTYFTYEKREIAKENIGKYSWAKTTQKNAMKSADKYLENYEKWYDITHGEGVPRSRLVAQYGDPYDNICRYCGTDVEGKYGRNGSDGFVINPISIEWKIQCPECKRTFPSNDFESFFELGVDKQGYFNLEKAYEEHKKLFAEEYEASGYADQGYGYLRNTDYPEVANQLTPENGGDAGVKVTINNGAGLRPGETVEGWGVDDSWGYLPKDANGRNYMADSANGIEERHAYIAYYYYRAAVMPVTAASALAEAYLYTGDAKYGRAGAILLDRIADVYESFDFTIQSKPRYIFWGADGSSGLGKYVGHITDASPHAQNLANACDILYPMLTDTSVINFLSQKATAMELENDKASSERIWKNWSKGILTEIYTAAQEMKIQGNFALGQTAVTIAAVVLDNEPETTEMIEWVLRTGENGTGGNVLTKIVDSVDRDGMGNETADGYNGMWINSVNSIAEYLTAYKGRKNLNLVEHPKFAKMYMPYMSKVSLNNQYANIGDNNNTGELNFNVTLGTFVDGFKYYKDTPFGKDLAQFIYLRNGFSVKDLKYDIFERNPERVQNEILSLVEDNPAQKSEMLAGYGYAILRDGGKYNSSSEATATNTLRDFWIHFGKTGGHGHPDIMNISVGAFGLNLTPDLGYPAVTGKDPERMQWTSSTLSHNTVMIGKEAQDAITETLGRPTHFDDAGAVKLIDVDAPRAYKAAEIYRRTVVMVKVDDDVSYGVDFFRVLGGDMHTFSFHGQAENAYEAEGLEMTKQTDENGNYVGSYAEGPDKDGVMHYGVDVPYRDTKGNWENPTTGEPYILSEPGRDPYTVDAWNYTTYFQRGASWLSKLRRDRNPEAKFAVEFDIKDYRKTIADSNGIKLRVTQMNNFIPDEVAIAAGKIPVKPQNNMMPDTFDYMLVKRTAENGETLDSMFTSVIEPYRNERYIENIELVDAAGNVSDGEMVRAVKVTHVDGKRVDYIVYATDNSVTYTVDNKFDFSGFVGVISFNENDDVIYRYVNDGSNIGGETEKAAAYTGTVTAFDDELEYGDFENWIDISIDDVPGVKKEDVLDDIVGRFIHIKNDDKESGAYKILGVDEKADGTVRLDIGTVTTTRSFRDSYDVNGGYVYNIAQDQSFVIPTSYSEDMAPEFKPVSNATTSAESTINIKVEAESRVPGTTVRYEARTLPRGASFDGETGVLTWKPTSSQTGENHVAIDAIDSDGRESTLHFMITVYGSTTGSGSGSVSGNGAGSGGAGGGGGGGGAAPAPSKPVEDDKKEDVPTTPSTPSEPTTPSVEENVRFVDLGAHAWASDAINALAEDGIIKGTSENTFTPASNITRADFALLLVRVFELSSDNAENFADVAEGDYFAKELATARNTGIVNGIGDNKYAPRNTITRQDMMTIVYRALTALEVKLESYDDPQYNDYASVAEYAKDAVKTLIGAGLINGKNGKIAPNDYTTRAEVAVLIKRISDFISK